MAKIRSIVSGWAPKSAKVRAAPGRLPPQIPMGPAAPRGQSSDPFAPPAALYGEVTVAPGSEGEIPSASISNNTGRAIEVREIRFTAAVESVGAGEFFVPAGAVRVTMAVNGKAMTASPTPIWSLARLDRAARQIAVSPRPANTYVMRLGRPMVLPPNAVVECRVANPGLINFSIVVGVCIAGRFTDSPSGTTAVPYAMFWDSQFRGYLDVTSETAPEKRFVNALKKTLQIERIICRHVTHHNGSDADPVSSVLNLADGRAGNYGFAAIAPAFRMAQIKLITSRNQPIIRDALAIWDAFEVSGAIEVPHVLAPNEFYRATVTTTAAPAAAQAGLALLATFRHQVHLSMVGWREEVL